MCSSHLETPQVPVPDPHVPDQRLYHPENLTSFRLQTGEDSREVDNIFNNIMEFCRINHQSFIDDSFPHSNKSIGDIIISNGEQIDIVWRQPAEIYTDNERPWTVFLAPYPTDIEQGLLGNCWFLSALAVIAERPEILERIVVTNNINDSGVYKIRLCVDGIWQTVFVDDFFPCHAGSRSMIFAVGRKNQLWVSLIEKALAKIYGNYAALRAGRMIEGLSILTGAPCEHIDLEMDPKCTSGEVESMLGMIWARLLSAKEANFLMGCGCGSEQRDMTKEKYERVGLVKNHAYSILDIKEYNSNRLLRLRNPWGTHIWNGEWSPSWSGWQRSEKYKVDLSYYDVEIEPGTFWIPFEKFVKYFYNVDVAHVREGSTWTSQRYSLDLSWTNPKILRIKVLRQTEICFTLFQKNARIADNLVDLMILVHKKNVFNGKPEELITRSERRCLASVRTNDVFLEPGEYVVCAVSLTHFVEEKDVPATLVVHSAKPVETRLETTGPETLRQSLIHMALAEGKVINERVKDIKIYRISENFCGSLWMVENLCDDTFIKIKTKCKQYHNAQSSRGTLEYADCIPPHHRQITLILTPLKSNAGFTANFNFKWIKTKEAQLGDFAIDFPDAQHAPDFVTVSQVALHEPVPMDF